MSKVPLEIPTRPFGSTGEHVSLLGLDNAWDYNDGLSEERMGKAIADRRDRDSARKPGSGSSREISA